MRGFGNPEETFIREQVMDVAALKIGMDPLEFRLKNICHAGDPVGVRSGFSHYQYRPADCIRIGAEKIGWKEKRGKSRRGRCGGGSEFPVWSHGSGTWPGMLSTVLPW
jgi:xanthine dehydrogenase molybdenum-binding subunit